MRVAVQSHKVNLVSMDRNVGDDVLIYELPVDSKLKEFTISISGENPQMSIVDPQGTIIIIIKCIYIAQNRVMQLMR